MTSSFSIWGCVLKGCFHRGIFRRAKSSLKGTEDFNLEHWGKWISGDVPKHDVEMTDAVIEVLAEANNQGSGDELNPCKEQHGEDLPSNMERNFCGFLVRKDAITFKIYSQKLNERIALLKDQLPIAKFIGPKPSIQDLKLWIQDLNNDLKGWVTCIESKDGIPPPQKVLVDYDKLPIRCRACHSWKHKVSNYEEI